MKKYICCVYTLVLVLFFDNCRIQTAYCESVSSDNEKSEKNLTSYEKRQKYGMWGGRIYDKDEGLWIYKSRFREYFGMPYRWVDDSLEGAEGIALRVARTARMRCHPQKNGEEQCVRLWQWQIDLYFTSDTDIGLPGTYLHNSKPLFNSLTVLAKKKPYLRERLDTLFDLNNVRIFLKLPDGKKRELSIEPYEYHIRGNTLVVSAVIDEETVLSDPGLLREVEFRNDAGDIVHIVNIPVSYWQRAQTYPQGFPGVGRENWAGGREVADFLWIYTKEFAEKFDMPKADISAELEGALAIAYRMGHLGTTICGYCGDEGPGGCRESFEGMLEVYLPEKAGMHYVDDNHSWQNENGYSSGIFLLPDLDKHDSRAAYYESLKTKLKRKKQSVGVRKPYMITRSEKKFLGRFPFSPRQYTKWFGGSGNVIAYYRPETLADGFGFYLIPSFIISYDLADCYLVFTDADHASYGVGELYDSNFHKVKLPFAYREKLRAYKEKFEKDHGSLWELIQKHIQN